MYIVIKSLKHYAQVILHNSIIFSMTYTNCGIYRKVHLTFM